MSNTAGPAEAINTDLTHTLISHFAGGSDKTRSLSLLLRQGRRKDHSNFIQYGWTPNLSLHREANGHKVQSSKVVLLGTANQPYHSSEPEASCTHSSLMKTWEILMQHRHKLSRRLKLHLDTGFKPLKLCLLYYVLYSEYYKGDRR